MRYLKYFFLLTGITLLYSCTHTPPDNPYHHNEPDAGLPQNIIFFIGDGMGLAHITAAQTVNDNDLNMTSFPVTGLVKTHAADVAVTCSAASGTAMATGEKTNYNFLGVDTEGESLKNLYDYLHEQGYALGLITTSFVMDATPGAFYAHVIDRKDKDEIARQMAYSNVDVLIGGGTEWMTDREDGLNLIDTMRARDYDYYSDLESIPIEEEGKLLALLAPNYLPYINEGRGEMLQKSFNIAIARLEKTGKPFFLMVENEHIDQASHLNEMDVVIEEVLDLDKTIGRAMNFASVNKNTLIVTGADHETGGFSVIGGVVQNRTVEGDFQGDNHTAIMVPFFAMGPGEAAFSGVYDNTTIFDKFMSLLQIK